MSNRHFGLSSRPASDGGNTSMLGGSRGAHAIQRTEIIRMPAGSIVQLPRLEPRFESLDPPDPGFYRALMFALPISLVLWGLIGLAVWLLASVFF